MKVTQMPPVHAANLVANSGNTAYGVDVIKEMVSGMRTADSGEIVESSPRSGKKGLGVLMEDHRGQYKP